MPLTIHPTDENKNGQYLFSSAEAAGLLLPAFFRRRVVGNVGSNVLPLPGPVATGKVVLPPSGGTKVATSSGSLNLLLHSPAHPLSGIPLVGPSASGAQLPGQLRRWIALPLALARVCRVRAAKRLRRSSLRGRVVPGVDFYSTHCTFPHRRQIGAWPASAARGLLTHEKVRGRLWPGFPVGPAFSRQAQPGSSPNPRPP